MAGNQTESFGAWSLGQLRTRYQQCGDDIEQLEALSSELKRRSGDGAVELQAEVAWTLTKARRAAGKSAGSQMAPAAPAKADFLSRLLHRHGLERADGRLIFRYQLSDEEFDEVERLLGSLQRAKRLEDPGPRAAALFVLYAAEWFRRHYDGSQLAWDAISPQLLSRLPYSAKSKLAIAGLKWWQRPVRVINGSNQRLLSIFLEGGLPSRVFQAKERGWLSRFLKAILFHLAAAPEATSEIALEAAEQHAGGIPGSFQQQELLQVAADLACAIEGLKRSLPPSPVQGLTVSVRLDAFQPGWREDLPIRLEGEGVERLIDDLVNAPTDRLSGDDSARCTRVLMKVEAGWQESVRLAFDGWIGGLGDHAKERLRVRASGKLAQHVVGELAILDPSVDDSGWRSRPRRRDTLIEGFPLTSPVEVEVSGLASSKVITWPKGEAVRGDVIVFFDPRAAGESGALAEPKELEFFGSGSLRARKPILYVLTPAGYSATAAGVAVSPMDRCGDKTLFRITEATLFGLEGDWWRVAPGEQGESAETLLISGGQVVGAASGDPRFDLITHPLTIDCRRGRSSARPEAGELTWKRIGDRTERPLLSPRDLPFGLLEISWRDGQAKVLRDRRRVLLAPTGLHFKAKRLAGGQVSYGLPELLNWRIGSLEPVHQVAFEGDSLTVRSVGQPPARFRIGLRAPGQKDALEVVVRHPVWDGGFCRRDGALFRQNEAIILDDLRGARAFGDGKRRLTLEIGSLRTSVPFEDETDLWPLQPVVKALAASSDRIDERVRLFLDPGGRRLDVGQYSVGLECKAGRVEIGVSGTPPGPGPFELIWHSIWDASEMGSVILRTADHWHELLATDVRVPIDLVGPGVVLLRAGGRLVGRPTVCGGAAHPSPQRLCRLQVACMLSVEGARLAAIDECLAGLSENSAEAHADLAFLQAFVRALGDLPPGAFNVLTRLPHHLGAATSLLVRAADTSEREKVWALQEALGFLWLLSPVANWKVAFVALEQNLSDELEVLDFTSETKASLVRRQRDDVASFLADRDDAVATALCLAGVLDRDWPIIRSDKDIAMDRARRMTESEESGGACVFHDDKKIAQFLPSCLADFGTGNFRQALAAPFAAAASAAGKAVLSRDQIIRIRLELAHDPAYFAEAYSAALIKFQVGGAA